MAVTLCLLPTLSLLSFATPYPRRVPLPSLTRPWASCKLHPLCILDCESLPHSTIAIDRLKFTSTPVTK